MFVDFKSLSKESRVWIFQSIQLIEDATIEKINVKLKFFLDEWKSHQMNFKSSFEIRNNTFIIIAADDRNLVSGCSIDSLVNFIKELESLFDLQLMDKLHVKYIHNNEIQTMHLNDFKILCQNLEKNQELMVFNNLVKNIYELNHMWNVDVRESWHKKYLK